MVQDSVEPKEDEARDAIEVLLHNSRSRPTEASEETDAAESTQSRLPINQTSSEEERLRAAEEVDRAQGATTENEPDTTEIDNKETMCGIAGYQPSWLQWFASKKTYVLVYGLVGLTQMTIRTYFLSIISTLEKRFKIPSRTSGLIVSGWDIGGLSSSLVLSYLGSRGHKTRWVAAGAFVGATTCFLRYLPHMIYGPGQDALELTQEYGGSFNVANFSNKTSNPRDSSTAFLCRTEYENLEDCSISNTSTVPVVIFFLASILLGSGNSMYYTLGVSYMDDNARKNKTPFLLAVWQCIRMLGPTCGFMLGSYVLRFYVDPSLHPTITVGDPRWIGAWWLAWVPLGVVAAILAFTLALFPKRLPRAAIRSKMKSEPPSTTTKSFSDFKMVMKRLLNNKILLLNTFSTVCFIFGYLGYWIFMPKYIETQFRQSASTSSLITGSIGLTFNGLGILAAGTVISLFKPRARYLAGWNVIVETLDVVVNISYSFLNCAIDDLHGSPGSDKSWDLLASCNADCDCGPMVKYTPVCSSEGKTTFYSPCHAGCTTMDLINGTKIFGNCSCIGDGLGWATDGACPVDCSTTFTIFVILQCTMKICAGSGRAGNAIIHYRCVDKDDKSMSISFMEALLAILAFIPGPIIYGMLLDSACMVWGQTCGKSGNCWLYNGQRLGYLLNFTASAFLLVGTLLDIGVWYYVKDLKIYDDDDVEKEKKKKRINPSTS